MSAHPTTNRDLTRRDALRLLALGAGAGLALPARLFAAGAPALQQAPIIRALQGDLEPSALADGPVLFHEHLSMQLGQAPSFMADVDLMIREVRAAQAEGIALIVDGGHPDMMRDLEALRRIARETGLPIVASGGYYMQRTYPPEIASKSVDEIAEELVAEARRDRLGAFGEIGQQTGVMTADERKVFEAVGRAHLRTGLPVFTHNAYSIRATDVPRDAALRQLQIFERVGANLANVCIGHMCCLDDPRADVAVEIARRGAYVGFDRVTLEATMPDANRVVAAMALVEAGHADKLLLSSDFYNVRSTKERGGPGLAQTATVFAPMLRQAGMSEETLRRILVENPRRFLAFVPRA